MEGAKESTTKRLILRKEKMEDVDILHKAVGCDAEITKFSRWKPYVTIESSREK